MRYIRRLKDTDNATVDSKDDGKDPGFTNKVFKNQRPKVRLGEAEQLICFPFVRGYALKRKKWRTLSAPSFSRTLDFTCRPNNIPLRSTSLWMKSTT